MFDLYIKNIIFVAVCLNIFECIFLLLGSQLNNMKQCTRRGCYQSNEDGILDGLREEGVTAAKRISPSSSTRALFTYRSCEDVLDLTKYPLLKMPSTTDGILARNFGRASPTLSTMIL